MLAKHFRLRKRTEFAYSYKHGKTVGGNLANMVIFKRRDRILRIGFSVSKKVGKAVVRARVKRQFSAIVRELVLKIERGHNLIFVIKPEAANQEFINLKNFVLNMLITQKLVKNDDKI